MSSNVTILIDSSERTDSLGARREWVDQELPKSNPYTCLGNSWTQPETALGTARDLFFGNFSFEGTALTFYGFVERTKLEAAGNTTFKTTIDGDATGTQTHNFFSASDPPTAQGAWYSSPVFSSGQHSVFLSEFPWEGVYIDYFTVGTGPTTNVKDKTIVIDDSDPTINYIGQWNAFDGVYLAVTQDGNPLNYVTPFGKGTHVSNTVGDAVQIPFTGASLNVYGFLRWNTTGSISLRFSLDDQPSEAKTFPPTGASIPKPDTVVETNYLFYSPSSLSDGDHVLQINVTAVEGDFFFDLDMITHKASYDTPESKPTITLPPLRIQSAEPEPSQPATPRANKPNVGAIVGGVIGGLVLLSIIGYILYKRRRKETADLSVSPFHQRPTATALPSMPTERSTFGTTILSWSPFVGGIFTTRANARRKAEEMQQPNPIAVTARNVGRVQELERHLEELERENELLQERQADPPPYEPGPTVSGPMGYAPLPQNTTNS